MSLDGSISNYNNEICHAKAVGVEGEVDDVLSAFNQNIYF